ncbi:MAG: GAF domain-containing protein [Thermodesulfovibrionales bacterium]
MKSFSRSTSAIAFFAGCLVIIGWMFDLPVLKSVLPGLVTMKANTALCFMLLGISLWLLIPEQSSQMVRLIARVFAFAVAIIGALTLSEDILGYDLGIDQLLFYEPSSVVGTSHPGRMAPNTALNFTMLSIALFLMDKKMKHVYHIVQFLALGTTLVGLLSLIGYSYGVRALYGIGYYTQMALHTAIIFILFGLGILFARPYQGFMAAVTSENTGSFMLRRILPVAIVTPVILGLLRLEGERLGLYSTEYGVALFVIMQIIVLSIVIWANAVSQNRIDNERKRAEEELKRYREHLEELVENRTAELKKVNRALKTLSECNQVLVRATEESDLLNSICRLIVEIGEYRLVWVGYAEQDEAKTVRPVAQAGYEEGYLDTLNISWADTERGRGPTGTAIRTGKLSICKNMLTDPHFVPWRSEAIKRGYASSIVLPLVDNFHTYGALNIYAAGLDAFDEEEVKLLTELANDFAYGIQALRTREERKRAEEALQYHEELLRETGKIAKVGGWEFDPVSRKGTWTDEVTRIHELDPETETNMELGLSFYQGESRIKIETAVKEAIELGKPYDLELEIITAKGNHKWVRTIGHPIIENGKVVKIRGSFQDITERKKAEEELKRNESRMITLLELNGMIDSTLQDITGFALEEAIRLTESQIGYLAFLNEDETVLTMYSWSKTAMEECQILDKPIIYPVETTGLWGEAVRQRRPITTNDYQAPNPWKKSYPEGHVQVTRHMNIPVFDGERIVLVAGVGNKPTDYNESDVNQLTLLMEGMWRIIQRQRAETEIKQLNAELEQRVIERTAQLEAVNKELEAFSYSVSHDLRAPIRHISGFVELLMQNTAQSLDEKSGRYLSIIADSTNHMGHLIDDILSFSRMGRAEMQQTLIKSDHLVKEAINQLQPEMEGRHVVWDIHPLPEIYGDPPMLKLVWINLIGNALKYTRKQTPAKIEIGNNEDKNDYIFYVKDNGAGFDMMYVHKLFNIFQRLHRAEEFEGTGVGLANVRRIIQRHGGRTWAEGKVNEGATFYFSLPKAKKNAE